MRIASFAKASSRASIVGEDGSGGDDIVCAEGEE